jgi:two-component system, sensor histidine kinase LadS
MTTARGGGVATAELASAKGAPLNQKEQVAAAVLRAQAELTQALGELEKLPAFDPGVVAFTAHVLTNYLTVAGGTIDLLRMSLADHSDPQIRSWLEALRHATDLMHHTVSRLMTSTAPQEAKLRLMKWDLPRLVQRACNYYQRMAEPKTIRIECTCAADVPPVWTDPVAVAAVLDNLISNAVKYSPPGKTIWVKVHGEGTTVVCSVRDEGPGLSPGEQMQLFQRGVRLGPQPTGGEPSTGYGLAVAKELVEQLSGQLWCESELGRGSCFSFRLPAYREAPGGP